MKPRKRGTAGDSSRQQATKGSASRKGAGPTKKKSHPLPKRKLRPVPIAVALRRVRPDTQIASVMAQLARGPGWAAMPELSDRSGSLNIHCVISALRRRFHWKIENKKERRGANWHSEFKLVKPTP